MFAVRMVGLIVMHSQLLRIRELGLTELRSDAAVPVEFFESSPWPP